jgi:hypothetical protein
MREPANKKELVDDLMVKAKQIEYLIQSLPTPEPEEVQVRISPQTPTPSHQKSLFRSLSLEPEIDLSHPSTSLLRPPPPFFLYM